MMYDILLEHHPVYGKQDLTPKYTVIFYDEDKKKALNAMERYVKNQGFTTPDKNQSVANVLLREREATGEVVSITPYIELFD